MIRAALFSALSLATLACDETTTVHRGPDGPRCENAGCAPPPVCGQPCTHPCGCCVNLNCAEDGGADASQDASSAESECAAATDLSEDPYTDQVCADCLDAACGEPGCLGLPCSGGKVLLRACTADGECADLGAVCARFSGPDNLCAFGDDQ